MWRPALLVALLVANLLLFAWAQGLLAPALAPPETRESEPQRLGLQHRPEWVSVMPGAAASAAVSAARAAARVCLEAGPFGAGPGDTGPVDEAQAGRIALAWAAPAQLGPAGAGGWTLDNRPRPAAWWISAGRYPDATARTRRETELRELKLEFEVIAAPAAASAAGWPGWADLTPALVVSRHASATDAEAALAALPTTTRRTLRIVAVPAGPPRWWLTVAQADGDAQSRLLALPAPPGDASGFKRCAAAARGG
jgi:hypothetical protein